MARISTLPMVLTLLLLGLLAKQGLCRPSSEDPVYHEDYANDDYEDSEDDADQYTGPAPVMVTQPLAIEAHEGDTVSLPCESTNLAQLLVIFASIWKKEAKFLFTDGHRGSEVDARISYHRNNNSLVIHNLKKEDAGNFTCIISFTPQLEVQHTINVFAPAMIKSIEPVGPTQVLKKGSSLTLNCNVTGYPPPTIKWTKKGKHESSEVVDLTSEPSIILNSVDRRDSGVYECSAENNQGPKASSSLSVRVIYAPEINVEEEVVATSENYNAKLKCIVHAEPKAVVQWLKNNEHMSPSDHIQFSHNGHVYFLDIIKVITDDFAKYTCIANNSLGTEVSKIIEVTGKPDTPRFVSANIGPDGRSLDVEWHIISYSPMVEYRLLYKQVGDKMNQTWHTEKPSVTEAENGNLYKLKHTLHDLPPGDFLVSLRARNDYGWSSQAKAHPFKISEKEENNEATAETSKMEETPTERGQSSDSNRPRLMAILTIISLSSFFL